MASFAPTRRPYYRTHSNDGVVLKKMFLPPVIVVGLLSMLLFGCNPQAPASSQTPLAESGQPAQPEATSELTVPLPLFAQRVTKKPFGIFIEAATSPVQPEKFTGFHTGTDFELLKDEDAALPTVRAICDGPIVTKKTASGYGGVVVQKCTLGEEDVAVLYGHLNIASVTAKLNDSLSIGTPVGTLGKGFSTETDGERAHLHLSIHKGASVVLLGYVQKEDQLKDWIDPMTVINNFE